MRFVCIPEKAPFGGAFFIACLLLVLLARPGFASDLYTVRNVIDGDTIVLENDDTVRFLGVNTPELGHGRFRDEPLANQARSYVQRVIEGKQVRLDNERPAPDRYGRRIAQVVTAGGENLQTGLLQRGLAFNVAVGDGDFDYLADHVRVENEARSALKGVWDEAFFQPVDAKFAVDMRQRGFRRVQGIVKRTSASRNNRILHLEGDFRVLIAHSNWRRYFSGPAEQYLGQSIEVRGWIFKSHGVTGIKLYHPTMLEKDHGEPTTH